MKIFFTQVYVEPGISYPFSHVFQKLLASEVSRVTEVSPKYIAKYGRDWELTFYISAKTGISENMIKGPGVYKKEKDVEYTIFTPYESVSGSSDRLAAATKHILQGVNDVLATYEIDFSDLENLQSKICDDLAGKPELVRRNA